MFSGRVAEYLVYREIRSNGLAWQRDVYDGVCVCEIELLEGICAQGHGQDVGRDGEGDERCGQRVLDSAQLEDRLGLDKGFILKIQDGERRERGEFALALTVESPRPVSTLANGRSSAGSKPSYWI